MKIKDFARIKIREETNRKIKKEIERDLFLNKKNYVLKQIDEKTWVYYWLRE